MIVVVVVEVIIIIIMLFNQGNLVSTKMLLSKGALVAVGAGADYTVIRWFIVVAVAVVAVVLLLLLIMVLVIRFASYLLSLLSHGFRCCSYSCL